MMNAYIIIISTHLKIKNVLLNNKEKKTIYIYLNKSPTRERPLLNNINYGTCTRDF